MMMKLRPGSMSWLNLKLVSQHISIATDRIWCVLCLLYVGLFFFRKEIDELKHKVGAKNDELVSIVEKEGCTVDYIADPYVSEL